MNLQSRTNTTNPLIRRVRRHQAMTTLFQVGQAAAPSPQPVQRASIATTLPATWVMGSIAETSSQVSPVPAMSDTPNVANQASIVQPTQALRHMPVVQAVTTVPGQPQVIPNNQPGTDASTVVPTIMTGTPIVQTSLQPTAPVTEAADVHASPLITQPTTDSATQSTRDPAVTSPVNMSQPIANQRGGLDTQRQDDQPAQRLLDGSVEPPQSTSSIAPVSENRVEDRTWSRLETIMAAHRRKERGEAVIPAGTQTETARVQRQVNPLAAPTPSPAPGQSVSTELPAIIEAAADTTESNRQLQRSAVEASSRVPPANNIEPTFWDDRDQRSEISVKDKRAAVGETTSATQETQRTADAALPQAGPVQSAVSDPKQPDEPSSAVRKENVQVPDASKSTALALEADGTHSTALLEVEPTASAGPIQLASEASVYDDIEAPSPSTAVEQQDDSALQPVPLQEMWPGVQQISHLANSAEEYEQDEAVSAAKSEPNANDFIAYADRTRVSDTVQRALQQVETAQPTESAVHVIPPRRPRPRIQQRPTGELPIQAGKRDPPIIPTNHQPVEHVYVAQDSSVMPTNSREGGLTETVVQPALVETEIGALPVDLWRLIDEPPPKRATQSAAPANSAQPTVVSSSSTIQTKQTISQPLPSREDKFDSTRGDVPEVADGVEDKNPHATGMPSAVVDVVSDNANVIRRAEQETGELGRFEFVKQETIPNHNGNQIPAAVGPMAISHQAIAAGQTSVPHANGKANPSANSSMAMTEPTNGLVQRQPDEAPAEPVIEDTTSRVDGVPENERAAAGKVDTDELAREVYSKLRHRLVIEGERLGYSY